MARFDIFRRSNTGNNFEGQGVDASGNREAKPITLRGSVFGLLTTATTILALTFPHLAEAKPIGPGPDGMLGQPTASGRVFRCNLAYPFINVPPDGGVGVGHLLPCKPGEEATIVLSLSGRHILLPTQHGASGER